MRYINGVFSYIDRKIQSKLEQDDRLVHLDRSGRVIRPNGTSPHLTLLGPIPLPRELEGEQVTLQWYCFVRRVELSSVLEVAAAALEGNGEGFRSLLAANMSVNSILAFPRFFEVAQPLVRVHSCCMTGDVFGSLRCECGPQLRGAVSRIHGAGDGGAVVYMSGHEGRGIGLWAKAITYLLQDDGQDTYQANRSLGLPEDSRDFEDAGIALRHLLGGRPITLLSNNPLKRAHLEQAGVVIAEQDDLVAGVCDHNLRYLRAKRDKGHSLPEDL